MKKLLIILAALGLINVANAQTIKETEIPAQVKEGFNKKFAGSKAEKWGKEGANYEAEFHLNKVETSALFDPGGNLIETESEIAVKDLPKAVLDYMSKNFPKQKIKEAAKITKADGTVNFEAEAGKVDYIFDSTGGFIKKSD